MVGCRWPWALKYSSDAPNSSGLSAPWPSLETSAWVWTSMAVIRSRSSVRVPISCLRGLGCGDAVGLGLGADAVRPLFGDGVGAPATVGEGDGLLLGVGPQGQAVAADADGLPGDVLGGVRGEEGDQSG